MVVTHLPAYSSPHHCEARDPRGEPYTKELAAPVLIETKVYRAGGESSRVASSLSDISLEHCGLCLTIVQVQLCPRIGYWRRALSILIAKALSRLVSYRICICPEITSNPSFRSSRDVSKEQLGDSVVAVGYRTILGSTSYRECLTVTTTSTARRAGPRMTHCFYTLLTDLSLSDIHRNSPSSRQCSHALRQRLERSGSSALP